MPIGSSSQRDRRRRVLLDDTHESGGAKSSPRSESSTSESGSFERPYTDEALVDNHLPTTWLVPKKFWMIGCIAVILAGVLVVLNLLNANVPNWSEKYGASQVIAFDMASGRGLVRWLTSFLLIVGASNSINIYLLRRHRSDDYRGTYRIWIWLTGIILLISMNASANFHDFLYALGEDLTREHLGLANRSHFLLMSLVPVVCIVLRVFIEIRSSTSSVAAFGMAVGAFLLTMMLRIESVILPEHVNSKTVHCNVMLVGYIALYLSTVSYSRFVFLDSQGQLSEKWENQSKRRQSRQARSEELKAERARRKEEAQLERAMKAEQKAERKSQLAGQKDQSKQKSNQTKTSSRNHEDHSSSSSTRRSNSNSSPLQNRVKQQNEKSANRRSNTSTKSQTASQSSNRNNTTNRLIPDFHEIPDDEPGSSIEELQQQLARSKSRSERKRLKKLIQQHRRAA